MDEKTSAREIGTRVRKFRMLRGWSQKDLGEKIQTTSAAISKYEKEGVHDIDVIKALENALDADLLKDEMDVEAEVGEIGLEILSILIAQDESAYEEEYRDGSIEAETLLNGKLLYGLSKDRILHELSKLESCGLCVREQFNDFNDNMKDIIYITSKGVVVLKRRIQFLVLPDNLKTYEMRCGEHTCIQDWVDTYELHKSIARIKINSAFRYNFLAHLSRILVKKDYCIIEELYNEYFPGVSCYSDILYSMMLEMNRSDADRLAVGEVEFDEIRELNSDRFDRDNYLSHCEGFPDSFRDDAEELFMKYLANKLSEYYEIPATEEENEDMRNNYSQEYKDLYKIYYEKCDEQEEFFRKYEDRFNKLVNIDEDVDVRQLFSKDQIKEWVANNILKASNDEEKEKQKLLEDTLDKYAFVRDYFTFPKEWEENGLAKLVREAYGISDIMDRYSDEKQSDVMLDDDTFDCWWTGEFGF